MWEFLRTPVLILLCIYAFASTPIFLFFSFRAVFNLATALGCRDKGWSWLSPASWVTRRGYTRDGYADLKGFAGDVGKGLLVLTPWTALFYVASH